MRCAEDMRKARADYVTYLGEGGRARGHQNLTHAVVKALHRLIIHTQETLGCPLLSNLNHKVKANLSLVSPQGQRPARTTTKPCPHKAQLTDNEKLGQRSSPPLAPEVPG